MNTKSAIYRQHIHNWIWQPDYNILACSKEKYFSDLSDRLKNLYTSAKPYWIVLKTFVNGRKVLIAPFLLLDGKIGTKFLEKAKIFN